MEKEVFWHFSEHSLEDKLLQFYPGGVQVRGMPFVIQVTLQPGTVSAFILYPVPLLSPLPHLSAFTFSDIHRKHWGTKFLTHTLHVHTSVRLQSRTLDSNYCHVDPVLGRKHETQHPGVLLCDLIRLLKYYFV